MAYDAFISYSRASERKLAIALQSGIQRIAKPLFKRRALSIFRDEINLAASSALWHSIEAALNGSRFLILLASPAAASSKNVQRELKYWLDKRSSESILIALCEGDIAWNKDVADFDWQRTSALPPVLSNAFTTEPHFIDIRHTRTGAEEIGLKSSEFRVAVARLAAPLRGVTPEGLESEDDRIRRRNLRSAWAIVALVLALGAAAAVAGHIAIKQARLTMQATAMKHWNAVVAQMQGLSPETASLVLVELPSEPEPTDGAIAAKEALEASLMIRTRCRAPASRSALRANGPALRIC